jgi:hypothetical protein
VSEQHGQEQQTEQAIKVRQVTEVHGNFNEEEHGEPGKFSFQFVLDDGADEYVLRPTGEAHHAATTAYKKPRKSLQKRGGEDAWR